MKTLIRTPPLEMKPVALSVGDSVQFAESKRWWKVRQDVLDVWEAANDARLAELRGTVREAEWTEDAYVERLRSLVESVQRAETVRGRRLTAVTG